MIQNIFIRHWRINNALLSEIASNRSVFVSIILHLTVKKARVDDNNRVEMTVDG